MQTKFLLPLFSLVASASAANLYSNSTTVAATADVEDYSAATTTLSPSFSVVPSVVVSAYTDSTTTVSITNTIYNTIYYTINSISSALNPSVTTAPTVTTQDDNYTSTTLTSTKRVTVTLDPVEIANLNKGLNAKENASSSGYANSWYYSNSTSTIADVCAPVTEFVTITADPIISYVTITPEPVTSYVTLTLSGSNSTVATGNQTVNGTLY